MKLYAIRWIVFSVLGLIGWSSSAVMANNNQNTTNAERFYLIKNATVHSATAKGVLLNTDVLIKNGKIVKVGQSIGVKGTPQIIDGQNKHITPGLINASTKMGLVEIDAVAGTVDSSTSKAGMGASFNIAPAVHFSSTLIPQNRINGLTRAIVLPTSEKSIFSGQGVSITLRSSLQGMLNRQVAQVANYGSRGAEIAGGSRAAAMQILDRSLTDARYLKNNESLYLPGYQWAFSQSIEDLKALYPVINKKIPLVVLAHRSDDILHLISLARKHNIRLVISGGGEAWKVASELTKAKVPVIMDPVKNIPKFDSLAVRLDGAAKLYEAGVKLLFMGGGTHNAYLVRQSAASAVANGMPGEAAIEAMTINTAEVFGVKNYGQIKTGLEADLVLWDGDPLEITSNPDVVFIQGDKQKLVSRATRLVDRYWELKGNHQQAYQR